MGKILMNTKNLRKILYLDLKVTKIFLKKEIKEMSLILKILNRITNSIKVAIIYCIIIILMKVINQKKILLI
jgi:hypothetical protein